VYISVLESEEWGPQYLCWQQNYQIWKAVVPGRKRISVSWLFCLRVYANRKDSKICSFWYITFVYWYSMEWWTRPAIFVLAAKLPNTEGGNATQAWTTNYHIGMPEIKPGRIIHDQIPTKAPPTILGCQRLSPVASFMIRFPRMHPQVKSGRVPDITVALSQCSSCPW
jgi:hypothetical protein